MKVDTLEIRRPMMHGPAVKRMQEMLDALGPRYDTGPNDGIFGGDAELAVRRFQKDYKLAVDGRFGPRSRAKLNDAVSFCRMPKRKPDLDEIINISTSHGKPKLYSMKRSPRVNVITGVTLHQTGCEMPRNPMGWRRVNAHIGITQEGLAILINPITDFIWHAQGLSKASVGIEIEGNYMGIDGDDRTLWKGGGGPHHLNRKMLAAIERVLWYIDDEVQRADGPIDNFGLWGHRQSKDTRIADPGEEIWKAVAVNCPARFAVDLDLVKGSGRPIPREWDERSIASYR